MTATTTAQALTQLKELAGKAGKSIYDRLGLVQQILGDHAYVAQHFGDESKALETLEADCFGDLCGARSLSELLQIRLAFPEEATWKLHRWNLTRLLAEWDDRPKPEEPKRTRATVTLKEFKMLEQNLAEANFKLTRMEEYRTQVDELRARIRDLERDKMQLEVRVDELERLLEVRFAGSRR